MLLERPGSCAGRAAADPAPAVAAPHGAGHAHRAALVAAAPPGSGATVTSPRDAALRREVAALMASPSVTASTAHVGVVVADAVTGVPVYRRFPDSPLAPASTQKTLTARRALLPREWLPVAHRRLRAARRARGRRPGPALLRGSGDPTLLERDLTSLASALRARGVTRVTGEVVGDASAFDEVRYSPYWSTSYASSYYAAQVSALTLAPDTDYDAGTVIVSATPATRAASAPRLAVTPASAASHVRLVNRARTSAAGTATTISVSRVAGSNTVVVTGQVPCGTPRRRSGSR